MAYRIQYPVPSQVTPNALFMHLVGVIQKSAETIGKKELGKRPIAINYSEYNPMSFAEGLMVKLTNRNISE